MSCYTTHRRKLAKRYGSFHLNTPPSNDVERVSQRARASRTNRRYGTDNEHRVIEAFSSGALPPWFVSIRPATVEEDRSGIDAWITTTKCDVAVQVESSAARAAEYRLKHHGYQCVVVVHPAMDDEQIRRLVLKDVERVLSRIAVAEEEKGKAA